MSEYKDEYPNGPQYGSVGFSDSPMKDVRSTLAQRRGPENASDHQLEVEGVKVQPHSSIPVERPE